MTIQQLKDKIDDTIKENGERAITGNTLNGILQDIVAFFGNTGNSGDVITSNGNGDIVANNKVQIDGSGNLSVEGVIGAGKGINAKDNISTEGKISAEKDMYTLKDLYVGDKGKHHGSIFMFDAGDTDKMVEVFVKNGSIFVVS